MSRSHGGNFNDGGNDDSVAQKKKPGEPIIRPHPIIQAPGGEAEFAEILDDLRHSRNLLRFNYAKIKQKWLVDSVVEVKNYNGSTSFLEVRQHPNDKDRAKSNKSYNLLYRADFIKCENPYLQGNTGWHYDIKTLSEYGLFIPTNAPAIIKAIQERRHGTKHTSLALVICEGEKTRQAVENRLASPYAIRRAADFELHFITTAWLQGRSGAHHVNLSFKPNDDIVTLLGVNDIRITYGANSDISMVFIIEDNDEAGRIEAYEIARRLVRDYGMTPDRIRMVKPPTEAALGWDDADPLPEHVSQDMRIDQIFSANEYDNTDWLIENDKIKPCDYNVDLTMQVKQELIGLYHYNEMTHRITISRPAPGGDPKGEYPRVHTDNDVFKTLCWIQKSNTDLWKINTRMVEKAIIKQAENNSYHPIRNYLGSLTWDEIPRLDNWLMVYLGALETDFIKIIGRKFFIGLVARVLHEAPCKSDNMLVLIGPQGSLKSTALNIIAEDEYFSDCMPNITNKDAMLHLQGKWIIEIAELSAIRRAEVEATKAFFSRKTDKFRPPYGRNDVEYVRQCIFVGTTNDETFLNDMTGNRRFWPVRVTFIDIKKLMLDREQLLAEAVAAYRDGEIWWLAQEQEKLAEPEQEEHRIKLLWEDLLDRDLGEWLDRQGVAILSAEIGTFLQEANREIPSNLWKTAMRQRNWRPEIGRLVKNGKVLRYWVHQETVGKPTIILYWHPGNGAGRGAWKPEDF